MGGDRQSGWLGGLRTWQSQAMEQNHQPGLSPSLPVGPGSALTALGTIPYTPATGTFVSFGHTLMAPRCSQNKGQTPDW